MDAALVLETVSGGIIMYLTCVSSDTVTVTLQDKRKYLLAETGTLSMKLY
jgi:hypothetical protein